MIDFSRLDDYLIDGWRKAYQLASIKLAGFFGLVVVLLTQFPPVLLATVQWWLAFPAEMRALIGIPGAVVLVLIIALVRLWNQQK